MTADDMTADDMTADDMTADDMTADDMTEDSAESTYQPPVSALLTYGDSRKINQAPDFVEMLGLGPEHIPDLIRMVTNLDLNMADASNPAVWAPVHAWQALGQLRAEAAIAPLLEMFDDMEEDDWFNEEIPHVFAMIGSAAIAPTQAFLADPSHPLFPRITAAHCLAEIGQQHPDCRADCVAALTQQLERFHKNNPELNGFLISYLLDLKAVEAAPIMAKAFAAKRVDLTIAGDWLDIQLDLGLKTRSEVRQLRTLVDAEHIAETARNTITPPPKGFGTGSQAGKKRKKK